jgi:hypothetical protein
MDQDRIEKQEEKAQESRTSGTIQKPYRTPELKELGRVEAMTAGSASFYIG